MISGMGAVQHTCAVAMCEQVRAKYGCKLYGASSAISSVAYSLPYIVGTILAGYIYENTNFTVLILISAAIYLIFAPLLMLAKISSNYDELETLDHQEAPSSYGSIGNVAIIEY